MSSESQVTIAKVNDIAVISPKGELDSSALPVFTRLFDSLLAADQHHVVLNLSDVDHAHYRIVRLLSEASIIFQCHQGDLFFVGATPYLKKIFQVAALNPWINNFQSLDEAFMCFDVSQQSTYGPH